MSDKIYLISQCAAHLVVLFVSLYSIVPMVIHVSDFRGHCALYSCGKFIEEDGRFDPQWSSLFYCLFTVIVAFLAFLSALSQLTLKIRLMYYNRVSSFIEAFLDFFLDFFVTFLVIIDSILVSFGFYRWCKCVTEEYSSCDAAASAMVIGVNSTINPKNFSFHLEFVQIGFWSLFVCMAFQLMLSTRKFLLYHDRENLVAVMARERLRYQQQN